MAQYTKNIIRLDRNENLFEHPHAVSAALLSSNNPDFVNAYCNRELQTEVANKLALLLTGSSETAHQSISAPGVRLSEPPDVLSNPSTALPILTHGAEDALLKLFLLRSAHWHALFLPEFSWSNYLHLSSGLGVEIHLFKTNMNTSNLSVKTSSDKNNTNSQTFCSKLQTFEFDWDDLRSCLRRLPKKNAVLIPSPNNPTGHRTHPTSLIDLVQEFPDTEFLVDGAYDTYPNEFCRSLVAAKPKNCYFIGSFSKFFGLPGLRLGFLFAGENNILPSALQLNLGFSTSTLLIAEQAIKHAADYAKNWNEMLLRSEDFTNEVSKIKDIVAYKSSANFVTLNIPGLPVNFSQAVENFGVLPKLFSFNGKHYLRWGMGPSFIYPKILQFMNSLSF